MLPPLNLNTPNPQFTYDPDQMSTIQPSPLPDLFNHDGTLNEHNFQDSTISDTEIEKKTPINSRVKRIQHLDSQIGKLQLENPFGAGVFPTEETQKNDKTDFDEQNETTSLLDLYEQRNDEILSFLKEMNRHENPLNFFLLISKLRREITEPSTLQHYYYEAIRFAEAGMQYADKVEIKVKFSQFFKYFSTEVIKYTDDFEEKIFLYSKSMMFCYDTKFYNLGDQFVSNALALILLYFKNGQPFLASKSSTEEELKKICYYGLKSHLQPHSYKTGIEKFETLQNNENTRALLGPSHYLVSAFLHYGTRDIEKTSQQLKTVMTMREKGGNFISDKNFTEIASLQSQLLISRNKRKKTLSVGSYPSNPKGTINPMDMHTLSRKRKRPEKESQTPPPAEESPYRVKKVKTPCFNADGILNFEFSSLDDYSNATIDTQGFMHFEKQEEEGQLQQAHSQPFEDFSSECLHSDLHSLLLKENNNIVSQLEKTDKEQQPEQYINLVSQLKKEYTQIQVLRKYYKNAALLSKQRKEFYNCEFFCLESLKLTRSIYEHIHFNFILVLSTLPRKEIFNVEKNTFPYAYANRGVSLLLQLTDEQWKSGSVIPEAIRGLLYIHLKSFVWNNPSLNIDFKDSKKKDPTVAKWGLDRFDELCNHPYLKEHLGPSHYFKAAKLAFHAEKYSEAEKLLELVHKNKEKPLVMKDINLEDEIQKLQGRINEKKAKISS